MLSHVFSALGATLVSSVPMQNWSLVGREWKMFKALPAGNEGDGWGVDDMIEGT
mgnify:FL=1